MDTYISKDTGKRLNWKGDEDHRDEGEDIPMLLVTACGKTRKILDNVA